MKILHVISYFLPHIGGIENVVYYLSKEFIKQDHEVEVITSNINGNKIKENIEGIEVKRCKAFRLLKTPFSFRLYKQLKKKKKKGCDIMHLNYPHPFFLEVGAFGAIKKKIPYILSVYGKEIELKGFMKIISRLYNFIFLNYALKHAAAIITNTKKVIPQSKYLKKYKDKIVTIPLGIDINKFKRVNTDLRQKLKNDKIILYVGALRRYKGLDYLIKAMIRIKSEFSNVKLIIIGKGEEEGKIKKNVKYMNLEENVIFKDFVPENELLEYYSIADLFILPSPTIEESFGLVALEALAMNIPVIVTGGAGVSEIFEKEKIDGVVKPRSPEEIAEKAIELLNNNNKNYRKILEKYNWKDISKKYLEVYNEILHR